MSKITDYLERQEAARARRTDPTTVAEFAAELSRDVATMIQQFQAAGLPIESATELVGEEEKERLLDHLRSAHQPDRDRPPITLARTDPLEPYIRSALDQENGAERLLLELVAHHIIWGTPVPERLVQVAHLVMAKAIVTGALQASARGRPKTEDADDLGFDIASEYWAQRDGGEAYQDVVEYLSEKHHKSERHIMRIVQEHTDRVGATFEDRERWRRMARFHAELGCGSSYMDSFLKVIQEAAPPELSPDDLLHHLEEQLAHLAAKK